MAHMIIIPRQIRLHAVEEALLQICIGCLKLQVSFRKRAAKIRVREVDTNVLASSFRESDRKHSERENKVVESVTYDIYVTDSTTCAMTQLN